MRITSGQIVVGLYAVLFILLPTFSHMVIGQAPWSIYFHTSLSPWQLATVVVISLCALSPLMQVRLPRWRKRPVLRQARWIERALIRRILPLSALIFVLVLGLYDASFANFRYAKGGLSAGGINLIIVVALKSCATILLLWLVMLYLRQGTKMYFSQRLATGLLASLLVFTVNGTADMLRASFTVLFALWPGMFTALAFRQRSMPLLSWKSILPVFAPIAVLILIILALTIGEGIKEGGSFSIDPNGFRLSVSWFFFRIMDGISSHYYAFVQFFGPDVHEHLALYDSPMSYPISAIDYRFNKLFGVPWTERPEIQSLSRLNFVVNSWRISSNEGTSPGVFGSFAYIFPLPIAMVMALIYLRLIVHLINRFFDHEGWTLSLFGGFFVFLNLAFFFESPLDFVNIFDNIVVAVFLFIGLSFLPQTEAKFLENKFDA